MAVDRRRCGRFATTGSIFAVRHGERADHADGNWHETAERPHDPPLTPLGLEQAASTGLALSTERVDAVYSSPFTRCMQTASAIAKHHGLRLRVEPGIGEMLADCEEHGWGFSENPYDEAFSTAHLASLFDVDTSYTPLWDTPTRGAQSRKRHGSTLQLSFPEEWEDAKARYQRTLSELQATEPFAVLVTHGAGVMSIAESALPPDEVDDCNYCCITQVHQEGGGAWRCTQRGTAHHGLTTSHDQLVLQR